MVASMTGFGRGRVRGRRAVFVAEVRSLNSRFCDVHVQAPRDYLEVEHEIARLVREKFTRGKFDVALRVESLTRSGAVPLDADAVAARFREMERIRKRLRLPQPVPLASVIGTMPAQSFGGRDPQAMTLFIKAAGAALERLKAFRLREGRGLAEDIGRRAVASAKAVARISAAAEKGRSPRFERLKERVRAIVETPRLDPARLESELALLAERSDVTEEIVRLQSHLERLTAHLGDREPPGRKLDFLLQEAVREINTIGAKANDLFLSGEVVFVKAELEKIREQAQNLE